MSRYCFHTADGHEDRDLEGVELPDPGATRKEAIRYSGAVTQDEPDVLWDAAISGSTWWTRRSASW